MLLHSLGCLLLHQRPTSHSVLTSTQPAVATSRLALLLHNDRHQPRRPALHMLPAHAQAARSPSCIPAADRSTPRGTPCGAWHTKSSPISRPPPMPPTWSTRPKLRRCRLVTKVSAQDAVVIPPPSDREKELVRVEGKDGGGEGGRWALLWGGDAQRLGEEDRFAGRGCACGAR